MEKYQIITPIKESNKGSVYLAKVEGYEFPVIVKELRHGNKAVFSSLCTLESTYIPKIYDVKEETDGLLVVEEYIEGETLSSYLASNTLTEVEWLNVAKQLCDALHSLHTQVPPIIHRDIKPSNIVIDSKVRVKLIDFDSSRLYKEESDGDTRLLGTERYAPPEQYGFSQTDCRSDIYSLGVVFGMFPEFSSKVRQKRWKQLVEKCTLFAPESRFQSAEAVGKEVEKVIRTKRSCRKTYGIVAGVLIVLMATAMLWHIGDDPARITGTENPSPTSVPVTKPADPSPTSVPVTKPADPSPTSVPVTKPDVLTQTTPPEWRDIVNEIPEYVARKEYIRNHQIIVNYCFQDRLLENGYWLQVTWLDRQLIEFRGLRLYSHRDDVRIEIEEPYYEIQGNLICIDKVFMERLEEGYYTVEVLLYNSENDHSMAHGLELFVAESDAWDDSGWWLQNTNLSFYGTGNATLHAVVKNDSSNKIVSVQYSDRTPVELSFYRILYDGKVLEFSYELLHRYIGSESVLFYVIGQDGAEVPLRIDNVIQDGL